MNKTGLKAFTVIELLIVITIMALLMFSSFIPYQYYTQKLRLDQSVKEFAKTVSDAKVLAMNWLAVGDSNHSIAVYVTNKKDENTFVELYSIPHSYTWMTIHKDVDGAELIRKISFLPWVQVRQVWPGESFLFFYHSISGMPDFFYWDASWSKHDFSWETVPIEMSYKSANSGLLYKKIEYKTDTHIINY